MALSITQVPSGISLAQSPIIFTIRESLTTLLSNPSFQYVGELYYWTGSVVTPFQGGVKYTISKYPNNSNVGIFDLNRILNSTLTDLAQQNTSSVTAYSVDFYSQYISGSTYVTGSHVTSSQVYLALDGYGEFPTPIGTAIESQSIHWPIMTSGPTTQSCFTTNTGNGAVWTETITEIVYSGSNGQNATFGITTSANTTNQKVKQFPMFPSSAGFPLSGSLSSYTLVANNVVLGRYGLPIRFNIVCNQKYPNVRIKWKNKFGQFDWFNFNMVNRQSFSTEKKTYQPQLGTWESSTFSYNAADSANLNYIVDSKQSISVNTDWVDEDYNDIFKQLMVSDEIYWVYDEVRQLVKPLTITTQNLQFKTGVVDKLIQYQFDFDLGQNYKLIM